MANPQIEDGHTKIANEIVEALCRVNLTSHESRLLWCVLRRTYGWHKKVDRISYSQFQKDTKIDRRHIGRSLTSLKARQIILCQGEGYALEYGLQKNYELWNNFDTKQGNDLTQGEVSKTPEFVENLTPSEDKLTPSEDKLTPSEATNLTPSEAHTKERKHNKSIIQKQLVTFEEYREKLRKQFTDLNFDIELEKYRLYWYEGRRGPPKNPKLALLNWMTKARQILAESDARRVSAQGNKGLPRALPDRKTYTKPEDWLSREED